MDEDYASVAALFETRGLVKREEFIEVAPGIFGKNTDPDDHFSALGIARMLEELATDYVDCIDGVLTIRKEALDSQIKLQEEQVDAINSRLEQKREVLERKFLVMEQTIALLQSQSRTLLQMGG